MHSISLSCHIPLAKASNTKLNGSGKNEPLCLDTKHSITVISDVMYRLFVAPLPTCLGQVVKVSFHFCFAKSLYQE